MSLKSGLSSLVVDAQHLSLRLSWKETREATTDILRRCEVILWICAQELHVSARHHHVEDKAFRSGLVIYILHRATGSSEFEAVWTPSQGWYKDGQR